MIDYKQTGDYIAAQKLELACRNLQHLIKIKDEQTSLEAIVASLEQSLVDAHANNPTDIHDILIMQTRILDAAFHHYIKEASGAYTRDEKIDRALRAQSQMVRTVNMWNKMKNAQKRGTN